MSAKSSNQKVKKSNGMDARMGPAQTYMNVESKGKYTRGKKKGSNRARRRLSKDLTKNPDSE